MNQVLTLLEGQAAAHAEFWRGPTNRVERLVEAGELVQASLCLFESIDRACRGWAEEVQSRGPKYLRKPDVLDQSRRFASLYGAWVRASDAAVELVDRFEGYGAWVHGSGALQDARRRAGVAMGADLGATLEAMDQIERGEGHTLREVRDGLRARSLAVG